MCAADMRGGGRGVRGGGRGVCSGGRGVRSGGRSGGWAWCARLAVGVANVTLI